MNFGGIILRQEGQGNKLARIMYKLKNHIAPDHLAQILNSTNSMYSYHLRNSNMLILLFVPRLNTEAGKNSCHYKGAVEQCIKHC